VSSNLVFNSEGNQSQWQCGLKQVCGCLLAVVVGLNPARGIDVCLVSVVCCQVEVPALG